MFNNKKFTLVGFMIVVAIIGILAAIAVPNFVNMQYKAKRAEVPGNVDGIKTAELAYDAAFDAFVDAAAHPGTLPGKTATAWGASPTGFDTIGWSPDGTVRGQYSVTGSTATDFTAQGHCDVDGDGTIADYTATTTTGSTLNAADANVY